MDYRDILSSVGYAAAGGLFLIALFGWPVGCVRGCAMMPEARAAWRRLKRAWLAYRLAVAEYRAAAAAFRPARAASRPFGHSARARARAHQPTGPGGNAGEFSRPLGGWRDCVPTGARGGPGGQPPQTNRTRHTRPAGAVWEVFKGTTLARPSSWRGKKPGQAGRERK